jgi:hypothetical protein
MILSPSAVPSSNQSLHEAQARGLIAYNPATPVRIVIKTRERLPIRIGEQIPTKADLRAILESSTAVDYGYKKRVRKTSRRRRRSQLGQDRWDPPFFTAALPECVLPNCGD